VIRAVVLDIEGTTSATDFVVSTLFPYARARYEQYLAATGAEPHTQELLDEFRLELGEPGADVRRIVDALVAWTDADAKVGALKALQGRIWEQGYADGALTAPFFPDVVPAVREWRRAGLAIAVYSSGSVDAQRLFFANSCDGNQLDLVDAFFDTRNAGPKQQVGSYEAIAAALGVTPDELLFLSDSTDELDAARAAGCETVLVQRPGEPRAGAPTRAHRTVTTFAALAPRDEQAVPSPQRDPS